MAIAVALVPGLYKLATRLVLDLPMRPVQTLSRFAALHEDEDYVSHAVRLLTLL